MNEALKNLLDDDDRPLSDDELDLLTGISKTTRWRETRAGRFPRKKELSPGRKANTLGQIREWHRQRPTPIEPKDDLGHAPRRGRPPKASVAASEEVSGGRAAMPHRG